MPNSIARLFGKNIVVCTKNEEGNVLYQNKACLDFCGKKKTASCLGGCTEYFRQESAVKTPTLLRARQVNGESCDILFVQSSTQITTLLWRKKNNPHPEQAPKIEQFALTTRELEIAQLIRKGYKNEEISNQLFISKATLKTHINRIYKKLGKHNHLINRS